MAFRSEVVYCYEELAATIASMLVLAHAKEWGQLPALEERCSAMVDRLRVIEPHESLDAEQVEHVLYLLERIRSDQAEVSGLIKPQLEDLIGRMGYLTQQKNLGRAYGPPH
ncbi:flagellar protein FliT [Variovorax sp. NFACC27]|uniref:flagellar protein FliT n=1 Tax=unclassified Variovorax TaxID=663243 RepID=UPI000897681B|nr:flagellar protein FliT [Variovorax sp. YR750]MDP9604063.1 flagellar protein FliT [Variovorax paradoxus]SEF26857.1 flagellar protein FliT [Variovorax sp. NFACC28]SEG61743.1 flagellar protein FliT [Variovorax sp. NFACC29]SFC62137.1 flagellar protein FliT [Variovorax sp. NFACC26]SFG68571.1 flagellar protein FliT [Variovorax sp. NFACC27]